MKRFFLSSLIALSLFMSGVILLPVSVSAAVAPECDNSLGFLGFPTWYKYLDVTHDSGNCTVVLPKKDPVPTGEANQTDIAASVSRILLAVFEIILRIAGILAVIFVVWGGIQYQLSQGEPDRLSKARSVIINALIGLAITVSATAIVNLVGRNIL